MATSRIPDLAVLVRHLRDAGMRVDVRQYLAAHEMLLAFAADRKNLLNDRAALASHLGPILCTSPEDQQLFENEFAAWAGPRPNAPGTVRQGPPTPRRRPWIATAVASLLGLLLAFALLASYLWREEPVPVQPEDTPSAPSNQPLPPKPDDVRITISHPVVVAEGEFTTGTALAVAAPWLFSAAGGAGCGAAAFLCVWLLHRRRRALALKRMPDVHDPELITLKPTPSAVIVDLPHAVLLRIATGLRRPRAQSSLSLSLAATIEATARSGGFVTPAFAPRVATPEYLFLIERRGEQDHVWSLIHRWTEQLRERDVNVDCFDFEIDPRVCTDGALRRHRLSQLLARCHRAVVVICAETSTLFDNMSGRPKPWLEPLDSMPAAVLLTLTPPYRWQHREAMLKDNGLLVLPATAAGLGVLAELDNEWHGAASVPSRYARAFPTVIGSDAARWLDTNAPPDDTIAVLLRQLNGYLGPTGFQWLCACALYPQITWDMTLSLLSVLLGPEDAVGQKRALTEQLPALARLPWFRFCYMPDWLRARLISQLQQDKELALRTHLGNRIVDLIHQKGDKSTKGVESSIARAVRPLDVALAAPPGSPLGDRVFIGFLAGEASDPLTLKLPGTVDDGPRRRGRVSRVLAQLRAFAARRPLVSAAAASVLLGVIAASTLLKIIPSRIPPVAVSIANRTSLLYGTNPAVAAVAPGSAFLVIDDPQAGGDPVIWDLATDRARARLQNVSHVLHLAVSPDSTLIAGVTPDSRLHLWSSEGLTKGDAAGTPPLMTTADGPVVAMSFSSDGKFLAVGASKRVRIVNVATQQAVGSVDRATGGLTQLDFGPSATYFTALFNDFLAQFAVTSGNDMRLGQVVTTRPLGGLSVSSDGRYAAYTGTDEKGSGVFIVLSDLRSSGLAESTFKAPASAAPDELVLSPRGEAIATGSTAGPPVLLDARTGAPLQVRQHQQPAHTRSQVPLYLLQFTGNGKSRRTRYTIRESILEITPRAPTTAQANPAQSSTQNNPPTTPSQPGEFEFHPPKTFTDRDVPDVMKKLAVALMPAYRELAKTKVPAELPAVEFVAGYPSESAASFSLMLAGGKSPTRTPVDRNVIYMLYGDARQSAGSDESTFRGAFEKSYLAYTARLAGAAEVSALNRLLLSLPDIYGKETQVAFDRWRAKGSIPFAAAGALVQNYFAYAAYQSIQPIAESLARQAQNAAPTQPRQNANPAVRQTAPTATPPPPRQEATPPRQEATPPRQEAPNRASASPATDAPSPAPESSGKSPPGQQSPVQQSPVQQSPAQQSPVQQSPVQQSPAQQSPQPSAPTQPAPAPQRPRSAIIAHGAMSPLAPAHAHAHAHNGPTTRCAQSVIAVGGQSPMPAGGAPRVSFDHTTPRMQEALSHGPRRRLAVDPRRIV